MTRQARVAVIRFSSDTAEMRLRAALSAAEHGDKETAADLLMSAVRGDLTIEIMSSGPVSR